MSHSYENIISLENLCLAWEEFITGKKKKVDVIEFGRTLMDNIVELHGALVNRTYRHGGYESFYITDPKRRHIHKASVRDRLLHHAVYRILYPFFDKTFIADSYSCRRDKGVHKALNRFRTLARVVSKNNTRTCWVLKCDIQKFFASIDHKILLEILEAYIPDNNILWLMKNIIKSYHTTSAANFGPFDLAQGRLERTRNGGKPPPAPSLERRGCGLPLGNLTSQLFSNIYLNEFDQWVKHRLGVETPGAGVFGSPTTGQTETHYQCVSTENVFTNYVRYADDFVFLSPDRVWLESIIPKVHDFLAERLYLSLHPTKIVLTTVASGIDFLGWVHFPNHRVLRTKTKQRMFKKIKQSPKEATLQSYLGLLSHGNTARLNQEVRSEWWLWSD